MGPRLISGKEQNDKIIQILASYLNDASPEVRFNARNALLSMENGPNPLGTKEEIERYVKKTVKKDSD